MEEIRGPLPPSHLQLGYPRYPKKAGPGPLNKFLRNLRNSQVRLTGYLQLRNAIANELRELADTFPRCRWIWASCVRQFRISKTLTRNQLTTMSIRLQFGNIDARWLLAWDTKIRVSTWPTTPALLGVELLWQFAKFFTAYGNSGTTKPVTNPTNDAIRAIGLLKNKTAESTGYACRRPEIRNLTQLPGNSTKLTQMAKTEALSRSGATRLLVGELPGNGDKLNIIRPSQGPIRSVAAGVRNYLRFCTMTDSAALPPSTGKIRRRIATFKTGETFDIYIDLVCKAAIPLGHDDAWLTPGNPPARNRSKKSPGQNHRFPKLYYGIRRHAFDPAPGLEEQHWHDFLPLLHAPPPLRCRRKLYNIRRPTVTVNF